MFKLTALLTLLWLPSVLMSTQTLDNFFVWRHQLTMYSGLLGLGYMGAAVLLAVRFRWVEKIVNGLDKGYRLHKQLGIGALIALSAHWLIIKSGPFLVGAGVLSRPQRSAAPDAQAMSGINWHALAEQVGDIGFKVFLIFSIISLVQAISYKRFKFTHKLGGVLMLAGIFHTAFLLDGHLGALPMNIAIAIISIIGLWCAGLSLSGRIGRRQQVSGQVTHITRYGADADNDAVQVARFSIGLEGTLDCQPGQFAYLNFHDGEAPHPFSILYHDTNRRSVVFGVKDLGDYTHQLVNTLTTGQRVTVEGGYGTFQIPQGRQQVWVGAGIGIVPLLSHLYALTQRNGNHPLAAQPEHVQLFYCVKDEKEAFFHKEITALLATLPFVSLQLIDTHKGERLNSERVLRALPDTDFDLCFCGPQAFGQALKTGLQQAGWSDSRFHREHFVMR